MSGCTTGRMAFYVGHHQKHRNYVVTDEVLEHAKDVGYDMLTTPITSSAYQPRVLSQISTHIRAIEEQVDHHAGVAIPIPPPVLEPLQDKEVNVSPNDTVPQLLLATSSWIDLASPDPLLADVSRQVLCQEITYAAFCGASNILVEGPRRRSGQMSSEGLTRFARAIQQALSLGLYIHLQIRIPMTYDSAVDSIEPDVGDLDNVDYMSQKFRPDSTERPRIETKPFDVWDAWNYVRTVCDYSSRLSIALTLVPNLPPIAVQRRWESEPLRILEIPGRSFVKNKHSIHVLPKAHQGLITRYMRLRIMPWILLSEVGPLPDMSVDSSTTSNSVAAFSGVVKNTNFGHSILSQDPTPREASNGTNWETSEAKKAQPYIEYVRKHLQSKQTHKSPMERFGHGYQDYLQNPLQPLTDNLESITYEVFEKDPIKYEWYERAIAEALQDWIRIGKPISAASGRITVAIVGAGRGPLVTRALNASGKTGIKIDLWALEKNANACVFLERRNATEWKHAVNLVKSDMRQWRGPSSHCGGERNEPSTGQMPIDILVSELLGSFGDNELSPECLDGVQRLLTPKYGISIPSAYGAFLTPISSPKLHADIRSRVAGGDPNAAMIPYVVMLHAFDYLSTTGRTSASENERAIPLIKRAWEFRHPLPSQSQFNTQPTSNRHNTRFAKLAFPCKHRGVCTGIAGYFESVLYSRPVDLNKSRSSDLAASEASAPLTIELSTNPTTMETKSQDMISWFPMYFPLKIPLYFPDNSELVISIWRQTDDRQVWYEWCVETLLVLESPNAGEKVRLGMTELHTSINNACLI